jgi:hypothetical protein
MEHGAWREQGSLKNLAWGDFWGPFFSFLQGGKKGTDELSFIKIDG